MMGTSPVRWVSILGIRSGGPMAVAHAVHAQAGHGPMTFVDRLNGPWHERAMQAFMIVVLAHWAEHLLQTLQIYALGWPVPEARGLIGYFLPWVIKSELLHY